MQLSDYRKKYPQYDDLTDEQLATGLHKKYYSDIDFNEFASKIGYLTETDSVDLISDTEKDTEGTGLLSGAVGVGKSLGKQALRFGPNLAKTFWQGVGFVGGGLESTMKTGKEKTGDFAGAFSPWEKIGEKVRRYGLSQAKEVQAALDHPFFNLPEEKRGKLWDNPRYMLDPEWLTYNAGDAIQSIGLIIGASMAGGPAAGMAVGGGMEGLDLYDQLIEEGANPDNAASAAVAFGIVTGVLNKVGADKVMEKLTGSMLKRFARRMVAGGAEASTEWAEEPFQAAFAELAKGGTVETATKAALEATKNVDVIPGAFLSGGLLAGSSRTSKDETKPKVDNQQILSAIQADIDNITPEIAEGLKKRFPDIAQDIDKIIGNSIAKNVADIKTETEPDLKVQKKESFDEKKKEIIKTELEKMKSPTLEEQNQLLIDNLGTRSGLPLEQEAPIPPFVPEQKSPAPKMPGIKTLLNKESLSQIEVDHLKSKLGKAGSWDKRIRQKLEELGKVSETPIAEAVTEVKEEVKPEEIKTEPSPKKLKKIAKLTPQRRAEILWKEVENQPEANQRARQAYIKETLGVDIGPKFEAEPYRTSKAIERPKATIKESLTVEEQTESPKITPEPMKEEPKANTPGMVRLDKGGVKPFTEYREIAKGKNKTKVTNKVEVTLSTGKKVIVKKEQIREYPSQAEKKSEEPIKTPLAKKPTYGQSMEDIGKPKQKSPEPAEVTTEAVKPSPEVVKGKEAWDLDDKDIKVSQNDLEKAPDNVKSAIKYSAEGVVVDAQTRLDYAFDKKMQDKGIWPETNEVYNAFNETRKHLKDKYGPTIKLYRLDSTSKISDKHTLNWTTESELSKYKKYDEWSKRELLSKNIPIDDIVAFNIIKDGKYKEFIVLNRDSKGLILPDGLMSKQKSPEPAEVTTEAVKPSPEVVKGKEDIIKQEITGQEDISKAIDQFFRGEKKKRSAQSIWDGIPPQTRRTVVSKINDILPLAKTRVSNTKWEDLTDKEKEYIEKEFGTWTETKSAEEEKAVKGKSEEKGRDTKKYSIGKTLFPESNRLSNINQTGSTWNAIENENGKVDISKPITIYRATIGNEIKLNDFVAINKTIAEDHLENLKDRGEKGKIIQKEVKASDLLMGNDATEFIYSPQSEISYSLSKSQQDRLQGVTEEDIKKAFPKSEVTPMEIEFSDRTVSGHMVTLPDGSKALIQTGNDSISFDVDKMAMDHGIKREELIKMQKDGRLVIEGAFTPGSETSLIELASISDPSVLSHEKGHWLFKLLHRKDRARIFRRYGTEEKAVEAFRRREGFTSNFWEKIQRVLGRIRDFIFGDTFKPMFDTLEGKNVEPIKVDDKKFSIKETTPEQVAKDYDLVYEGKYDHPSIGVTSYNFHTKDGFSLTVAKLSDIPRRLKDIQDQQKKYSIKISPEDYIDNLIKKAKVDSKKTKEQAKYISEDLNVETGNSVKGKFSDFIDIGEYKGKKKKDLRRITDILLSTPLHYSERIPTFKRLFNTANEKIDIQNEMIDRLTKHPDGRYYTRIVDNLKKTKPEEYKKWMDYRIDQDKNQKGYRVRYNTDTEMFDLYGSSENSVGVFNSYKDAKKNSPDNSRIVQKGDKWEVLGLASPIASYASETEAWRQAILREASDFEAKYRPSSETIEAFIAEKTALQNGFNTMMQSMRNLIDFYKENGLDQPSTTVTIDGEKVQVNLDVALATMGDRRGYYFPRIRNNGQFMLSAQKGNKKWMNFYDLGFEINENEVSRGKTLKKILNSATPMGMKARELRRQGWKINPIELAERTPEDVFIEQTNRIMNEQTLINDALKAVQKGNFSFDKLGFDVKETEETDKDGTKHNFTTFYGITNKAQRQLFKDFGGQFYALNKGGPEGWHFKDPGKTFDQRMIKALANISQNVDKGTIDLFAQQLVDSIAELEKGRGARAHMIRRDMAQGDDVWEGYETDISTALSKYIAGIAGSESKKIMAGKLMKQFFGTDISWNEFKEAKQYEGSYEDFTRDQAAKGYDVLMSEDEFSETNDPEGYQENRNNIERLKNKIKDAEGQARLDLVEEKQKAYDWMHSQYRDLIDDRRIDAQTQTNAWRDGKSFIENMLRNPETTDRILGTLKGIAVFKYLAGRVSAPVVNLTALATSVPGAMNSYGNIPIVKSLNLIRKYANKYMTFSEMSLGGKVFKKSGRDKLNEEEQWVFDQIKSKGWDNAQFNREALTALESKIGIGWQKTIDALMIGFGVTEQLNRASTIAGAYFGLKQSKPDLSQNQRLTLAKEISDKAHGVYNKSNMPAWARGSGIAGNLARSFYVFKTFSHNYLQTMAKAWGPGWTPAHAKAFSYMAISPAILAGSGALVGKEVLTMLLKAFGIGGDDPEEEFYNWVAENYGDTAENYARYGIVGGLTGVNLKGSLSIGITDLPTNIQDFMGAPGDMVYTEPKNMITAWNRGNKLKAVEHIPVMPLFLSNMIKAYREGTEGVTTWANTPLYYGDERLKADEVDMLLKAFSFNPVSTSKPREIQFKESQVVKKYQEEKTDINARFKKFFVLSPEKQTKEEHEKLINMVIDFNNRIDKNGLEEKGLVTKITSKSLKSLIKQASKAPKRERLRDVNK